jgi:transcriptional regulator with XRE-family HTH domain
MTNVNPITGHKLRVAMVDAGLTQQQLGDRAGISLNTVSRHMRSQTPITVDQLMAYSRVLGASFTIEAAPATGLEPVTYRTTAAVSAA